MWSRFAQNFKAMKPSKSSVWTASNQIEVKRFRGGLVFKAHRLVYHPTSGLRVIKKKKNQIEALAKVNFPHPIKFRALCGANVVTLRPKCQANETLVWMA